MPPAGKGKISWNFEKFVIDRNGEVVVRFAGWTPDGEYVLFRSQRNSALDRRLWQVPVAGGLPEVLPMPRAGSGDYAPDGQAILYSPLFRDFRTWKRYRGGRAQDVWVYDLEASSSKQLTDNRATDNQPVWVGEKIYFTSDRERRLNLYAYDTATGRT